MVVWVWVIIALVVFQIVIVPYSPGAPIFQVSSVLVLVASLGILYRIYRKQQLGKLEELEMRIAELENRFGKRHD